MKYDISTLLPFHKESQTDPETTHKTLVKKLESTKPSEAKKIAHEPVQKAKVVSAVHSKATPVERQNIDHAVKNKAYHVTADTTRYPDKSIEKVKHTFVGMKRSGSSMNIGEGRFYSRASKTTNAMAAKDHNQLIKTQPELIGTATTRPIDPTYLAKFNTKK